ncbi:MAG: YicC family protein [Alphaproteobacteria bacterium]|nr:YicC family protein [Alphaproteobacteria bacterium]
MTVASMTGFARASGSDAQWRWAWEARSVNGRGLDLRLRLPPGLDRLDQPARAAATKRFQRGSLSLTLTLERIQAGVPLRLNRQRLDEYLAILRDVGTQGGLAPARLDGLLALRGVIESSEDEQAEDAESLARFDAALLATLESTLTALAAARAAEGERLAAVFEELLGTIAGLARDARELAATQPETLRARLMAQLAELAATAQPDRLAQEVALLATKADVREELDRLDAHVAQARGLLGGSAPAGRKLEFLAQEFNREANTLCSKSTDLALTRLGLDLKVAIDRLREQAANLE